MTGAAYLGVVEFPAVLLKRKAREYGRQGFAGAEWPAHNRLETVAVGREDVKRLDQSQLYRLGRNIDSEGFGMVPARVDARFPFGFGRMDGPLHIRLGAEDWRLPTDRPVGDRRHQTVSPVCLFLDHRRIPAVKSCGRSSGAPIMKNRAVEDRIAELERRVTGQSAALYAIAVGISGTEPAAAKRIMSCLDRASGQLRKKHHPAAVIAEVEKVQHALSAALVHRRPGQR
jgi:hypothetical protein